MELLVPFFLAVFSTHFQSGYVMDASPVIEAITIGNSINLITSAKAGDLSYLEYTFTTFRKFITDKTNSSSVMKCSDIPKDILEAFLVVTFYARCTQATRN